MIVVYGTYNQAKLDSMRRWLAPLPISLLGLRDFSSPPSDIEETGMNPLENARIKAVHYQKHTGLLTMATDSGLYLEGVPDALQPATHVRRVEADKRMSDEEMIEYYASLASSYGGRLPARYRNALCIAFPDGHIAESFDDSLASILFYLVDTPHARRVEGFPLDSLSVDIDSGNYFYDIMGSRLDSDERQVNGFCQFIQNALGIARK